MPILEEFKQVVNDQNLESVPTEALKNREGAIINMALIASICNCTTDHVCSFLQRMKDLISASCLTKKKTVCLNIAIGHMWFYPNKTFEFKSAGLDDVIENIYTKEQNTEVQSRATENGSQLRIPVTKGLRIQKMLQEAKDKKNQPYNSHQYLSNFLQNQI